MNLDRVVPNRFNEDISVNEQGGQLLDLCISSKFSIRNARTGDFRGKFTYVGYDSCSTIDLVLASENIINEIKLIQYLQIRDLLYSSDHKTVILKILLHKEYICENINSTINLSKAPGKFILEDKNVSKFALILNLEEEAEKTET